MATQHKNSTKAENRTDTADIPAIEKAVGHVFSDKEILLRALTHRSFSNEQENMPHNERLEFLGDAILQFFTTRELYALYPEVSEGTLSVYRSLIVKTDFLVRVADSIGLIGYIQVSVGQRRELVKTSSLLADAVEALIGAIYLDGGMEPAERFVLKTVLPKDIKMYLAETPTLDAKTVFQEYIQREQSVTPGYVLVSESGPDHDKEFTVAVEVGGEVKAEGTGKSKREAEQRAAEKAYALYTKRSAG